MPESTSSRANKALLAAFGGELFGQGGANATGRLASRPPVAGGIPIINALRNGLAANEIDVLAGIVNGTSNYILTAMEDDGWAFADALAEAQRLGYAESRSDLRHRGDRRGAEAGDPGCIGVLTRASISTACTWKASRRSTSRTSATPRELGFSIKHLGIARLTDAGVEARVHPALVP